MGARAVGAIGVAGLRLGVLLLVLIPLLHHTASSIRDLILTGFALLGLLAISIWRPSRRDAIRLLTISLAAFVLLQVFFATNQASEPFSDFHTQWEAAARHVSEGFSLPDRPQTQRSVPFYYPLILMFGSAPSV